MHRGEVLTSKESHQRVCLIFAACAAPLIFSPPADLAAAAEKDLTVEITEWEVPIRARGTRGMARMKRSGS
jgi:hypothetical protein